MDQPKDILDELKSALEHAKRGMRAILTQDYAQRIIEEIAALRAEVEAAQESLPCPRCTHYKGLMLNDRNCCRSCVHDAVDNFEPMPQDETKKEDEHVLPEMQ